MKTANKLVIIFAFALAVIYLQGDSTAQSDNFKEKVSLIFENNCVMCHGGDVQRSGLDLRSPEAILKGGSRGPAIVPGNAEKSILYRLIAHKEEPAMPMGGAKLPQGDLDVIANWINSLTLEKGVVMAETLPVRAPGYSITEKDRQFWSFIKPVRPA